MLVEAEVISGGLPFGAWSFGRPNHLVHLVMINVLVIQFQFLETNKKITTGSCEEKGYKKLISQRKSHIAVCR